MLVGTDAARVTPDDAAVVRELDGLRWYRCLRCDAWEPRPRPDAPSRPSVPARSDVEVPRRGPLLRDRYLLRLIALERLVHVVVFWSLAVAAFVLAGHRRGALSGFTRLMTAFYGGSATAATSRGLFAEIRRLLQVTPAHLAEAGGVLALYGLLEAVEAGGLWVGRRWAEYLTFVATVVFVPFEIYEIASKPSAFKIGALVVNVAVAAYLLWAKRLFGLRGGEAAERRRRLALGGWAALDAAGPPTGSPPGAGSGPQVEHQVAEDAPTGQVGERVVHGGEAKAR